MLKTTYNLEVRYYETDLMGVVHHSNYIRYLECARHQCLVDLGLPIDSIERDYGIMMPVTSVECNYHFPAKMGDVLRIESRIEKMPKARIEVLSDIFNQDGKLLADAKVVLGFIHSDTRKPTRIPECLHKAFSPYFDNE